MIERGGGGGLDEEMTSLVEGEMKMKGVGEAEGWIKQERGMGKE